MVRTLSALDVIRILKEIPLGKSSELWLTNAALEYIGRGGRVIAQPAANSKWLTIGDLINYQKIVIENAMDDAPDARAIEPRIRSLLVWRATDFKRRNKSILW